MYTFKQLHPGDMFNTMIGRWVKIDNQNAIYVIGALRDIGSIEAINDNLSVVVLFSPILRIW